MKVILLNDFGFVNGGAAQVAITEALGLADLGVEVIYFCGIGPLDDRLRDHPNIQSYQVDGFDVLTEPNRVKAAFKGSGITKLQKVSSRYCPLAIAETPSFICMAGTARSVPR